MAKISLEYHVVQTSVQLLLTTEVSSQSITPVTCFWTRSQCICPAISNIHLIISILKFEFNQLRKRLPLANFGYNVLVKILICGKFHDARMHVHLFLAYAEESFVLERLITVFVYTANSKTCKGFLKITSYIFLKYLVHFFLCSYFFCKCAGFVCLCVFVISLLWATLGKRFKATLNQACNINRCGKNRIKSLFFFIHHLSEFRHS